jgi:hypothetical protein
MIVHAFCATVARASSLSARNVLKRKNANLNREDAKNAKFKRFSLRPSRLRGEKHTLAGPADNLHEVLIGRLL